jgi:phosphate-selective porin OprO and OprP
MELFTVSLRWNRKLLLAILLLASGSNVARAQTPPASAPSAPPAPTGNTPPPPAAAVPTAREAALEARVQQLEAMMQQMATQMSALRSSAGAASAASPSPDGSANANAGGNPGGASTTATPSSRGPLSPGQSSPPSPPPSDRFNMPPLFENKALTGKWGPGFEFKTADEEFVLQFHDLTQVEFRGYQQGGQEPTHDTFALPRQWWMFSGRITKPWEYFVSFQNGFDTFTGLDMFLNAHYDDRIQIKMGRFKSPFTYEFYTEPVQGLIQPERSLFFNNFALNRSVGGMIWGRLFNTTAPLDYAVGIFNGDRNSFLATSDAKNVLAYLNWRPFALFEGSPLENFVFGGSVQAGTQTNLPMPAIFRTVVATSGNAINGVPWLAFNPNARESGGRVFWDLHAAWYYQHLSLIAEWQSGYQDYAMSTSLAAHDRIGIESYYVQAGYFITGETVSGRNIVKPLRDFDIRKGKEGPGAIELATRFNSLGLTKNIFTSGLSDPNLWTNNLYTVDVGFNWYLNQYIKVCFDWQHAVFGNPVLFNASALQKTSDLFLLRFQLYF